MLGPEAGESAMLCWGKAADGQLGLGEGGANEEVVLVPKENPFFTRQGTSGQYG